MSGLSQRNRELWRLIAAAGSSGVQRRSFVPMLAERYDAEAIDNGLKGLQQQRYIRSSGANRYAYWRVIRTPAGETAPEWLETEAPAPEAAQAQGPQTVVLPQRPYSVFALPVNAATEGGAPSFALHSTGEFVITAPGAAEVKLPPDVTRAMFRWLDQLQGVRHGRAITTAQEA